MHVRLHGFVLKVFISFSPVLKRDRGWLTVLTVYLVQQIDILKTRWFQVVALEKPLKRLHNYQDLGTGMKPGENEMKILGASQVGPDPGKTRLGQQAYLCCT